MFQVLNNSARRIRHLRVLDPDIYWIASTQAWKKSLNQTLTDYNIINHVQTLLPKGNIQESHHLNPQILCRKLCPFVFPYTVIDKTVIESYVCSLKKQMTGTLKGLVRFDEHSWNNASFYTQTPAYQNLPLNGRRRAIVAYQFWSGFQMWCLPHQYTESQETFNVLEDQSHTSVSLPLCKNQPGILNWVAVL